MLDLGGVLRWQFEYFRPIGDWDSITLSIWNSIKALSPSWIRLSRLNFSQNARAKSSGSSSQKTFMYS